MTFQWVGRLLQGAEDKNTSPFRIGQEAVCVSIYSSLALLSSKAAWFLKASRAPRPPPFSLWNRLPGVATRQSEEWPAVIFTCLLCLKTFQFTPEESSLPPAGGGLDAADPPPPPPQGRFLRLVSHISSHRGSIKDTPCVQAAVGSHLTLEPVARVQSCPEVPEAASSRGRP